MSGRRALLVVLAGYVISGALVLIAAGRVWRQADLVAATGARVSVHVTGHAAEPALPALGIAVMVLVAAVVAARGWVRRVVGLITVVSGGAIVALAIASRADATHEIRHQAFAVSNATVGNSLSAWAIATMVGGLIAIAVGALTVVQGPAWPALGSRYESPAVRRTDDLAGDWDALDRGEDPTV